MPECCNKLRNVHAREYNKLLKAHNAAQDRIDQLGQALTRMALEHGRFLALWDAIHERELERAEERILERRDD